MKIAQFIEKHRTTRDTIRYYIEMGLLTPNKKGSWYDFTEQDSDDFESIRELKELGLSIKGIKEIKDIHETLCGTEEQWVRNMQVITNEISGVEAAIQELMERKQKLELAQQQLKEMLYPIKK